jgi:UDP-N-acetylglucosamine:LPS N-acetylglucosamine transferase
MAISFRAREIDQASRPAAPRLEVHAGDDDSVEVRRRKILLVGSGGGHWVQLMRVASAFADHECVYVTTVKGCEADVGGARLHLVNDANRNNRLGLLMLTLRMLFVVLWERPDVVVSTGAAPGYFALRFGKSLGARTAWLDSVANVERLSLSGQLVAAYADLWLTQWPHLSRPDGPHYEGTVL